ncbi:hypothetical protein B0G84_8532 [Paraburkholderia sp. BL8N3]|nr:hypothetical protein B0G84_8532 [Paraburkholderia sp. BL8N3]
MKAFARRMAVDHTKPTAQLKMAVPRGVTVSKDNSDTAVLDSLKACAERSLTSRTSNRSRSPATKRPSRCSETKRTAGRTPIKKGGAKKKRCPPSKGISITNNPGSRRKAGLYGPNGEVRHPCEVSQIGQNCSFSRLRPTFRRHPDSHRMISRSTPRIGAVRLRSTTAPSKWSAKQMVACSIPSRAHRRLDLFRAGRGLPRPPNSSASQSLWATSHVRRFDPHRFKEGSFETRATRTDDCADHRT